MDMAVVPRAERDEGVAVDRAYQDGAAVLHVVRRHVGGATCEADAQRRLRSDHHVSHPLSLVLAHLRLRTSSAPSNRGQPLGRNQRNGAPFTAVTYTYAVLVNGPGRSINGKPRTNSSMPSSIVTSASKPR